MITAMAYAAGGGRCLGGCGSAGATQLGFTKRGSRGSRTVIG